MALDCYVWRCAKFQTSRYYNYVIEFKKKHAKFSKKYWTSKAKLKRAITTGKTV